MDTALDSVDIQDEAIRFGANRICRLQQGVVIGVPLVAQRLPGMAGGVPTAER
jgi:hypothetical protein